MSVKTPRRAITADDVLRWPHVLTQVMYTRDGIERFLAKVDIRGDDECWPWTGTTDRGGYGVISICGKQHKVHRLSVELAIGIPLGDLNACHHCDSPPCCHPLHLFAGTQADNVFDCVTKGRKGRGLRPVSMRRAA